MYNHKQYAARDAHNNMSTLLETFASYLPALVVSRHMVGAAPAAPVRHRLPAALLFADISGFTALTERLAQRGPDGVEELTRMLNVSFGQILDLIEIHGGDVVKFAGDALAGILPTALLEAAIRRGSALSLEAVVAALAGQAEIIST